MDDNPGSYGLKKKWMWKPESIVQSGKTEITTPAISHRPQCIWLMAALTSSEV